MGDVVAVCIGQATDTEHPQTERVRRKGFGHHRHPDNGRAQPAEHLDLGRGLECGTPRRRVHAFDRGDPQRLGSRQRGGSQGGVIHRLCVDERRHPVGEAPAAQRRRAHHVQVIAQHDHRAGHDARNETSDRGGQHHRADTQHLREPGKQRRHVGIVSLV